MAGIEVKDIHHLGIVAGVVNDLKIVELVNQVLPSEEQDQMHISYGETVKGMILNALGFVNAPLSLTSEFFETKDLEALFRRGVKAEHFNRHKLGRTLDRVGADGSNIFAFVAASIACSERVDTRVQGFDTSSFSMEGDYTKSDDEDEHPITITHGFSKDSRPDLKQFLVE
jgi:transposase